MKTLLTNLSPGRPVQLRQVPDSALLTGGRPLFLREGQEEVALTVMPAVRISRLGLAIAPKFARRYYDAATLVALNTGAGAGNTLTDNDLVADNALTVGGWLPVPESGEWEVATPLGGTELWNISDSFERAISAISERTTFKTGDIVVLTEFATGLRAPLNSHPEWALNGARALSFKIK